VTGRFSLLIFPLAVFLFHLIMFLFFAAMAFPRRYNIGEFSAVILSGAL
jgi:hypothetical protein